MVRNRAGSEVWVSRKRKPGRDHLSVWGHLGSYLVKQVLSNGSVVGVGCLEKVVGCLVMIWEITGPVCSWWGRRGGVLDKVSRKVTGSGMRI